MSAELVKTLAAGLVERHAARLGMDAYAASILVDAIRAIDVGGDARPARTTDRLEHPTGWPRPASPCDLRPIWIGEFRDHADWVSFATHRLAGVTGSMGEKVSAICVDALGRRCNIGADFARARDENAFPVRYFWECE
jgi:hypothetical protein